jgi:aminoglycoside 6-adenylyltransferase
MDNFLKKLLIFAENDHNIRLVLLNGSRANPNNIQDKYSDYDIIFGVLSFEIYEKQFDWMNYFGEIIITQNNINYKNNIRYPIFLIQYTNNTRLDASFFPMDNIENILDDSLTVVLLDKDNIIKTEIKASEKTYITKEPSLEEFKETTNEFLWCCVNVAKGIARKELCYAKYMYESTVRICFIKIISWYIGEKNNWKINTGKFGKDIEKYVSKELWEKIKKTYNNYEYKGFWKSLLLSCKIIREMEIYLRKNVKTLKNIPMERWDKIIEYIKWIKKEPNCT